MLTILKKVLDYMCKGGIAWNMWNSTGGEAYIDTFLIGK